MTHRAAAALALALLLVGCGPSAEAVELGDPVELVTGVPNGWDPVAPGCYTFGLSGPLVADPVHGTAILPTGINNRERAIVGWRPGYTGRRVGSEVAVLDPVGNIVAVTGRSYSIAGGGTQIAGIAVFWACDDVTPI